MKKNTIFIIVFLLSACSATEEIYDDLTSPDYVSSSRAKKLEVPPDLSELETSNVYSVPGEAKSYRDFVENENSALANNAINKKKIIEKPEGMKIVKSGTLRWLVVEKEPDKLWPHVKEFWEDLGFRVLVANKRTGIIETQWMDTDDLKLDTNTGALSTFDKWLDSLSGFADKRKFRTRIEYGESGTTEIYISQRSAEAAADQHSRILSTRQSGYNTSTLYKIDEYKSDDSKENKVEMSESRALDDYEIDSELLMRLMIKLGATNFEAKKKVDSPELLVKAKLVDKKDDFHIQMIDPYDRSWRRLGLALDIIGFVTEDKNRSDGIYYVRYSQTELPSIEDEQENESEGIIDSLIFWDDDKKEKNKLKNDEIYESEIEDETDISKENYTGIQAPDVKPIDEEYNPDEIVENQKKSEEEETWLSNLWPKWGDENQKSILPENEKRFRVRIKPKENNETFVYLDYSNGKRNNSAEARKVLKIIYEHLK